IKEVTNRPVVCTLQGEDLFIDGLEEKYRRETLELVRAQAREVDAFIAVSDYYARFMSEYLSIPEEKMRVVPLGVTVGDFPARARGRGDTFVVGYFARVAPEKGLRELCEAYKIFRELADAPPRARLEVAGYLGPEHRDYLKGIEQRMADWGLAGEFNYRGTLDRAAKIEFLGGLDVFSVPAPCDEPKGLSVIEALAAGVPVVQPRRGAYTEMVERTGGGLLVEPGDAPALAGALHKLWKDPALAAQLGRAGAAGARAHYSVARMADRALEVYGEFARAV
ncbi:MAG: glycosyltransferase family 4 protein, partial [Acidobacteria bacterium]|nr:glycosyltransferase family 4 protein [Acidobacteriota bacterium]